MNKISPPPNGYVDSRTIAARLNVRKRTVLAWYNAGKMPKPSTKLGLKWLWKEEVIGMLLNRFAELENVK